MVSIGTATLLPWQKMAEFWMARGLLDGRIWTSCRSARALTEYAGLV